MLSNNPSGNNIGNLQFAYTLDQALEIIAQNNPAISRLKINGLNNDGANTLVKALVNNTTITELDVSNNTHLTYDGVVKFIDLAEQARILKSLDITNTMQNNSEKVELGERVSGNRARASSLISLKTEKYPFGAQKKINWYLEENLRTKDKPIFQNTVATPSAPQVVVPQPIASKQPQESVAASSAQHNAVSSSSAYTLPEALQVAGNKNLTNSSLKLTNLDDQGAKELAKMLETNTNISELDVSGNNLSLAGVELLIDIAATTGMIKSLNIANNPLNNHEKEILQNKLMNSNTYLPFLDVSGMYNFGSKRRIEIQCSKNQKAPKKIKTGNQESSFIPSALPVNNLSVSHTISSPVASASYTPAPAVSDNNNHQPAQQPALNTSSSLQSLVSWKYDPITDNKAINAVINKQEPFCLTPAAPSGIANVMRHYNNPGQEIAQVQLFYSKNFETCFDSAMETLSGREGLDAFKPHWNQESFAGFRKQVMDHYKASSIESEYSGVRLIAGWHGTDSSAVNGIGKAGFANLATTDTGYFGKGIYVALEAEYAQKVYQKDALILTYVAIHSPYPVVEDGEWNDKIKGKGNYSNYDAHIVPVKAAVNKNGVKSTSIFLPCSKLDEREYTEVVTFDSARILPRYLVQTRKVMIQGAPANNLEQAYCYGMAALLNNNYNRAVEHFDAAAQEKYGPAEYMMGLMYFHGVVVEQSYKNADRCLTDSANHGYPPAYYDLGHLHDFVNTDDNHIEKASKYYSAIQETHSASASRLKKFANRYGDQFFVKDAKGLLFFNPKMSGQKPEILNSRQKHTNSLKK